MAGEGLPWRSSILGTLLFLPSSLREADSFLQHRSKPLSLPPARTAIGLRTDAAVSGRGTAGGTVGRVPSADADGCTGAGSVPAWTRVGWAAVLATAVPATGVGWAAGWAARVSIAQRRELRIWLGERRAFVLAVAFLCSLNAIWRASPSTRAIDSTTEANSLLLPTPPLPPPLTLHIQQLEMPTLPTHFLRTPITLPEEQKLLFLRRLRRTLRRLRRSLPEVRPRFTFGIGAQDAGDLAGAERGADVVGGRDEGCDRG